MVQPVTYDPLFDLVPAIPGMIADAMFTDKITIPCGPSPQPFGTVVGTVAATGRSVLPTGTNVAGIAIHDHLVSGRFTSQDTYVQYDPISVMARGRIWVRASGACTKDAVAKYDPATGIFADAGASTYPNARFLTGAITVIGIAPGDATSQTAMVEVHSPTVA